MRWVHEGVLACLDTETTGIDPAEARVVDIALALIAPGKPVDLRTATIDPGVEVPESAARIHGFTTERVQAEGKPAPEVLELFLADIAEAIDQGAVLTIMNAPYDLPVLHHEARRHGLATLEERLGRPIGPVADPGVLDKHLIKYRKRVSKEQGARQLKTLAQVYGVPWDDSLAHGAAYDALQAGRVLWRMAQWSLKSMPDLLAMKVGPFDPPKLMHRNDANLFQGLGRMSAAEVHTASVDWYREQTESLGAYWASQREQVLADAGLDNPPLVEGLSDAGPDERREVLRAQADELAERIASLRFSWPIAEVA